jgi:predicted DCC family thiol-disulfide oxidoreductase YuxK
MEAASKDNDDLASAQAVILFDGVCVLCSAGCRFVARRDAARRFRYIAMQSAEGRPMALELGIDPDAPKTFAAIIDGRGYVKSDAALHIVRNLPGWRWTWAFRVVPRVVRDAVYDFVARHRYRWFGRYDACVLSPFERTPPLA